MQTEKTTQLQKVSSEVLAREIVKVLIEKKGIDVTLFDVRETTSVTDFYINVTGRSTTHVGALADDVAYMIGLRGRDPERIEGKRGATWILVDYMDVIVNVFDKESRSFYNFERLLPVEGRIDISELEKEVDEKLQTNK